MLEAIHSTLFPLPLTSVTSDRVGWTFKDTVEPRSVTGQRKS